MIQILFIVFGVAAMTNCSGQAGLENLAKGRLNFYNTSMINIRTAGLATASHIKIDNHAYKDLLKKSHTQKVLAYTCTAAGLTCLAIALNRDLENLLNDTRSPTELYVLGAALSGTSIFLFTSAARNK